jgi:hypothetical protein
MAEKKKPKPPLVQQLTQDLIAELHLNYQSPTGIPWTPVSLYEACIQATRKRLRNLRGDSLTVIGVHGKGYPSKNATSLFEVNNDGYRQAVSGRSLIREIAARTLIAAMFDILRARDTEGRATLRDARHSRLERDPPSPAAGFGG